MRTGSKELLLKTLDKINHLLQKVAEYQVRDRANYDHYIDLYNNRKKQIKQELKEYYNYEVGCCESITSYK